MECSEPLERGIEIEGWEWQKYKKNGDKNGNLVLQHLVYNPQYQFWTGEAKVSELMKCSVEWNEQLIRRIFNNEEADQICSIPISRMDAKDKLVWGATKKGFFLVKSAYHLEVNRKEKAQGEFSGGREVGSRWRSMWELNVLGKVKLFMWRARNELLAKKEPVHQKISKSLNYPKCKRAEEVAMHV